MHISSFSVERFVADAESSLREELFTGIIYVYVFLVQDNPVIKILLEAMDKDSAKLNLIR